MSETRIQQLLDSQRRRRMIDLAVVATLMSALALSLASLI
jgi:hypothetical protein